MASSPRILNRPTGTNHTELCEMPVSQFIIAARAQASRRCETQAPLSGTPLSLLAFRSLDPFRALRKPDRRRRDKERFSCSEQKLAINQKQLLDRKSPIQVRIQFPPPGSLQTFGSSRASCGSANGCPRPRQLARGRSNGDCGIGGANCCAPSERELIPRYSARVAEIA